MTSQFSAPSDPVKYDRDEPYFEYVPEPENDVYFDTDFNYGQIEDDDV